MSTYKSDFLNVLATRGFIQQVSEPEALDALAHTSTITAYIGFDCTAPSLHVGSLLPIMLLYWLPQTGHRPIALMGGGTNPLRGPSGKGAKRPLPACRLALADHVAVLAAADRPPADRADGRRHNPRRRSFGQGRKPPPPQ